MSRLLGLALAAVVSGWRGARRWHLRLAPLTLLSLAWTVVMAERMAGAREFPWCVLGEGQHVKVTHQLLLAPKGMIRDIGAKCNSKKGNS